MDAVQSKSNLLVGNPSLFQAKETLGQMTLQQKVGQLFIGFFWGKTLSEKAARFLEETKLGNVIYFTWANGLEAPEQIASLSKEVQDTIVKTTGVVPFISVDQEGGFIATRLLEGFTKLSGNMALGITDDLRLAYESGKTIARELQAVGINLNLAPVVDVQRANSLPWYIGIRTFGTTPDQVVRFAKEQTRGFAEQKLPYVLKHAPGLGGVAIDPHKALPICDKPLSELESFEFLPFQQVQAPAIMTAHVIFPAVDLNLPASLSSKVTTDLIRKKWGFEGVIMTDSLSMNAVLEDVSTFEKAVESVQKAAIQAILAGADMLILGKLEWADFSPTEEQDQQVIAKTIEAIVRSVQKGEISEDRLNESVLRILQMKQKIHANPQRLPIEPNFRLAEEIATKSLTLLSPSSLSFSEVSHGFSSKKVLLIAPKDLEKNVHQALQGRTFTVSTLFFEQKTLQESTLASVQEEIQRKAKQSDLTLFFSFNATVFPQQGKLMKKLAGDVSGESLVFVGLRNPHDLLGQGLHTTHITLFTYSPAVCSLQAVFDSLEKGIRPLGKLPFPSHL